MKKMLKNWKLILIVAMATIFLMGATRQGRRWISRAGGNIEYTRGNVVISNGTLTTSGGQTVSSGDIVADNGNIRANNGNVRLNNQNKNVVSTDHIWCLKTIVKTISIVVAASADDFQFDDTQANNNEQFINLGELVPAWGELVSAQVRCIESYVSSEANPDDIISLDIGVTSGNPEVLATDTIDDVDDFITGAAGVVPIIAATAAAKNIWINMQPEDNWTTITAGRYAILITYIDNGAAYTNAAP